MDPPPDERPVGAPIEERGYDEVEDHVESCVKRRLSWPGQVPERALLYRGIGAVRVRATHADRTTVKNRIELNSTLKVVHLNGRYSTVVSALCV